jgi:hypothetical protein
VEKLQCHPILDLAIAGRARFFADGLSLPKVLLRALVKRLPPPPRATVLESPLTGTGGRPFRKPPTKRAVLFDCPPAPEGPRASLPARERPWGTSDNLDGVPIGPRARCLINEIFIELVQSQLGGPLGPESLGAPSGRKPSLVRFCQYCWSLLGSG